MDSLKRTLWAAAIIAVAVWTPVAQSVRADDTVPVAPAATVTKVDIPLGSPDFYPSSERPIGWRGDRTGAFPGATLVTTWNSKTDKNIVWKTQMPAPPLEHHPRHHAGDGSSDSGVEKLAVSGVTEFVSARMLDQ